MSPEGLYSGSVRALSLLMIGLGLAIVVVTLVNGGGALSFGVVMGIAFIAVGAGRLFMASRMKQ